MSLIDISPPLHVGIGVWPGDTPLSRQVLVDFEAGGNLELSTLRTTVHLGAHADAPSHYRAGGSDIAGRELALYYGPCEVISVDVARGDRIRPDHLPGDVRAPRVLFHTGTFPDPDVFNEDFAALSAELVAHLHDAGVRLVGIDTPSVDPFASKALEAHNAVAERDMAVLEGLVLGHVAPGIYTLVALPLRLVGFDASPVRAALIPAGPGPRPAG
ncbi:MAG: cyclase family protein [Myxococcota bacterium]|nr:cyclase family protein [Myxococcota bacterium]